MGHFTQEWLLWTLRATMGRSAQKWSEKSLIEGGSSPRREVPPSMSDFFRPVLREAPRDVNQFCAKRPA